MLILSSTSLPIPSSIPQSQPALDDGYCEGRARNGRPLVARVWLWTEMDLVLLKLRMGGIALYGYQAAHRSTIAGRGDLSQGLGLHNLAERGGQEQQSKGKYNGSFSH